jgi:hypothetical protein
MTAERWKAAEREIAGDLLKLGMPRAEAEAAAAQKVEMARRRFIWARERLDAFFDMQERAGEAYMRQIEAHPDVDWESDDAPRLPEPPEEAAAQAIYAEVMAALNEDRWPRHLHFRDV